MRRGDLVLTSDNYLGIVMGDADSGHPNEFRIFCGNELTSLYPESYLQLLHFKSTGTLLTSNSNYAVANFVELLKEE